MSCWPVWWIGAGYLSFACNAQEPEPYSPTAKEESY